MKKYNEGIERLLKAREEALERGDIYGVSLYEKMLNMSDFIHRLYQKQPLVSLEEAVSDE
jgi:hypothetical protein